ncbi:MAG TPA: DUF952 domain-containing protein [Mycobacteriales bacterium]|jgi:Uncharacterized protein conserved in bacteria
MERIFHITDAVSWRASRWDGYLRGDTLESDGYIHFSLKDQVERVANARYRGQRGLVVLEVDPQRMDAPVRMEAAEDGEEFPHLYGPLDVSAVTRVHELRPNPDGSFTFRCSTG